MKLVTAYATSADFAGNFNNKFHVETMEQIDQKVETFERLYEVFVLLIAYFPELEATRQKLQEVISGGQIDELHVRCLRQLRFYQVAQLAYDLYTQCLTVGEVAHFIMDMPALAVTPAGEGEEDTPC